MGSAAWITTKTGESNGKGNLNSVYMSVYRASVARKHEELPRLFPYRPSCQHLYHNMNKVQAQCKSLAPCIRGLVTLPFWDVGTTWGVRCA